MRFVGEPVVAVAAENRYVAEDALERIVVEYEPLPAVVDVKRALEPGSPLVHEQNGTNLIFEKKFTWGEVEKAFQEADKVFTEQFIWNRLSGNTMETANCIAQWNPLEESLTMWMAAQNVPVNGYGFGHGVADFPAKGAYPAHALRDRSSEPARVAAGACISPHCCRARRRASSQVCHMTAGS